MKSFLLWGGIFSIIFCSIFLIVLEVKLTQSCVGHLKRAADANTIERAQSELGIVINYLENNNLTDGYTSIFYRTPDEDINYWYNNLKESNDELLYIINKDSTTNLEKSNQLIKLRETLLDNTSSSGDVVTCPAGFSRYPYNAWYALWFNLSWIFITGGVLLFVIDQSY